MRELVGNQVGHAELAAAELAAESVGGSDVLDGPAQHTAQRRRGFGRFGGCGEDPEAVVGRIV